MKTTVIVPTYNEGCNARALLARLDAALRGHDADVLFVDDGSDDLPEVVDAASSSLGLPVRVIRRAEPVGRLGGAVVEGMRNTDSELLVVCDGDLQHPPELIPQLIARAADADLVVASRYVEGGDAGGLSNGLRKVVSRSTGALSRLTFPQRLRRCTDPMSGFFAVRRAALDLGALQPSGFKILLELVARSRPLRLVEVPFTFGERVAGRSHAGVGEGVRFLRQLVGLRLTASRSAARAVLFMLVGLSGVLPNLAVLRGLESAGVGYLWAAVLAVQASIVWNFVGAETLVWRDFRSPHRWHRRFLRFLPVGETDLLRIPFVVLLVEAVHLSSTAATVITLGVAFMLRFVLADKVVYRRGPVPVAAVELGALEYADHEQQRVVREPVVRPELISSAPAVEQAV